jgi:hypothetical protein
VGEQGQGRSLCQKDVACKKDFGARTQNLKHHSLVESSMILLPPLQIKLGVMKNFVKPMDRNGTAFLYLRQKFSLLSNAKI